jgi:deoxyribose-phosphate aldolase
VVDDNEDIAESLAMMLDLLGSEVRTARDGLEAVAGAEAYRPDVILMDLRMPRMDGYEACRRIREQPWGKGLLIAAVTGQDQEEDRRRSREAGFDEHLVKPVNRTALEHLLASAPYCGLWGRVGAPTLGRRARPRPTEEPMPEITYAEAARMIDHSLLQPVLTDADLERGCLLAREYGVASVCIKPYAVRLAAGLLAGAPVAVGTTVGFPHGGHVTAVKVAEAERALDDGARELDMVVNVGKVLSKDYAFVADDVRAVVEAAHRRGALVKVIFENCFLQDEHKEELCRLCGEVGADFVKTSTGYGDGGATDDDLRLMRRCAPPHVGVKAAGGVRTFDRLLAVRALGVSRVGATATRAILDECRARCR